LSASLGICRDVSPLFGNIHGSAARPADFETTSPHPGPQRHALNARLQRRTRRLLTDERLDQPREEVPSVIKEAAVDSKLNGLLERRSKSERSGGAENSIDRAQSAS
jgi:hypothetical protein